MTEPQYRFAYNRAGMLVDIRRLTDENRDVFKCPSCGKDMIMVLPIQDIVKHFRHKNTGECNGETYLHNAAKRAFKQSFDYYSKHGGYFVRGNNGVLKISDVFVSAVLEAADDGGTIPDITLSSRRGDSRQLFIEIFVTHRVNWHSAMMRYYPTIEIPITSEADIERLRENTLDLCTAGVLLYENGLDISRFLSSEIYLTAHQVDYIERYGWGRFEDPDISKPSILCALAELGALDNKGRADFGRLAAIRAAYEERNNE